MEKYFATLFEVVRPERSLILLLTLTDQGMLMQAGILVDGKNIEKFCFGKLREKNFRRGRSSTFIRLVFSD